MSVEIKIPRFDPAMKTAIIVEWLKKEGDAIKEGDSIAVLEGEKTTFELKAHKAFIMEKILYGEGSEVEAGTTVARGQINEK
jgi:pyruvate/2-oxoglutarate dehydrogenase complex dihydrolipoamide acyltransferase (E2) component